MPSVPSIPPPPVGALIADGSLELVDVLGYGGYGIVYRAVDAATRRHQFAVKCLTHAQAARQRTLHLREIQLHRLASAHPAVVSLTRVVEDASFTYIVLDYYADGDLFTQILHKKRYLGNEALIKDVYLQLLDAVQHCHDLGVYHRDLKPENVLCRQNGDYIAITDFGLATTDEMSTEFRTGSIYHMSPECHGPDKQHPSLGIASKGGYNPAANDVWSLGIMLLNLTTGRNPWKSATSSDPTFWAYLHDRANFLPTVLPVSRELNALLVRILDPIWSTRITLPELRREVVKLRSIYADDVVFDDAMARCAWEVALEPESPEESMAEAVTPPPVPAVAEAPAKPSLQVQVEHSVSVWSEDTPLNADAHMSFASPSDLEAESFLDLHDGYILRATQEPSPVVAAASTWSARSSAPETWRHRSANPSPVSATMPTWLRAASDASSQSDVSADSVPSLPPTPKVPETKFTRVDYMSLLAIDTDIHNEAGPDSALYSASSYMRTAVESADDEQSMAPTAAPWTSHFFRTEPAKQVPAAAHVPDSVMNDVLKTPVLDDEPISPLRFRYMARVDSLTSLGHDADIEDSDVFSSRPIVPRSAPAATTVFQPFGAGRSFFAPRPSGASSSSSVSAHGCVVAVAPRTPAGGKMRSVHTRRGSGRFNPLRLALRSLSPGRAFATDQASSASDRSRSPSPKASVEPRAQRPRLPSRKSTGKLGWLGGRLFGAAS